MLVSAQRWELGRDHVRRMLDVDPEPRIREVALPAHLCDGDVGIPIGDGRLSRVCLVFDLSQAIRWREHEWRALPVLVYRGSYLPGPQDWYTDFLSAVSTGDRAMMGAHIEISVRPAVLAPTDARHDRVVHGGMTERAGDAKPRDVIVGIHRSLQTHDWI